MKIGTIEAWMGIVSPSIKKLFIRLRPFQTIRVIAYVAIIAATSEIAIADTVTIILLRK
jgi:hypothetical protein